MARIFETFSTYLVVVVSPISESGCWSVEWMIFYRRLSMFFLSEEYQLHDIRKLIQQHEFTGFHVIPVHAFVPDLVKISPRIEVFTIKYAIPHFRGIFGVKNKLTPFIEYFKRNQFVDCPRHSDEIGIIEPIPIGGKSSRHRNILTFDILTIHYPDADTVGCHAIAMIERGF